MNFLPELRPNKLHLILAPRGFSREIMTNLVARLAQRGPVQVLDGGNCFDLYSVVRAVRTQVPGHDSILERIQVARAFTCYQMLTLLEETPAQPEPVLVLELLSTFRDENNPIAERQRLLKVCLSHLDRLSQHVPVAASAYPAREKESEILLEMLEHTANQIWHFESSTPTIQPSLF
jgi:hypothetical protein